MAQVITTILLDGNPKGLRLISVDNWSGHAFVVPRPSLGEIRTNTELQQAGIYFLFGDGKEKEKVYIGQTNSLVSRLMRHDNSREDSDWDIAVGFSSVDAGIPQYLESKAIKEAREAGQFEVSNSVQPVPTLAIAQQIMAETYFKNIELILITIGYKIFEKTPTKGNTSNVYTFEQGGALAKGTIVEDGSFVIFEGSTARKLLSAAFPRASRRLRETLINENILEDLDENLLIFSKDCVFKSPSGAGNMVAGVATNGWMGWKDMEGNTLDENLRK